MADEKLDLILQKVIGLEKDMSGMKSEIIDMKSDIVDMKTEINKLHRNDELILNEVERVHEILNIHKENKSVHVI